MTAPAAPSSPVANDTVVSADGVRVGFHLAGAGTPIVIVHGSISTGEAWLPVAGQLAADHSVYVLDRRGRGLSGDSGTYTLGTEATDITALLDRAADDTGAAPVLVGHSFGAICCLEAVRLGADIASLVLYEPPLPVDAPVAGEQLAEYAEAVAAGDHDAAMRIAAKHFLRISDEETDMLAASPMWDRYLALVPTWTRELAEIDASVAVLPQYGALPVRTHLLVGERSPAHLTGATAYLEATLPEVTTTVLRGQSHFAHSLDPAGVANAIRAFIAEKTD
ncbi:alpha/beta fold hydrolase [Nocardia higoensis]|uniref:alpha/beta fold hydrolase n=1 Tax=Nocardia higoensis TaxID=228599 RepID=UPI0002DE20A9|nr:alpha/beta hydrolase [Nocardia higoensis]